MSVRYRTNLYVLCLAALLTLAACAGPAAQNPPALTPLALSGGVADLLTSGAFESGDLGGWNVDGGAAASNAEAHAGRWSARMTYGGAGAAGMRADVATNVATDYKVTAWVRIVSETGDDWGGFRIAATSW